MIHVKSTKFFISSRKIAIETGQDSLYKNGDLCGKYRATGSFTLIVEK